MMLPIPMIPESAPFSAEQRAWLNGFFAGVFGLDEVPGIPVPANPGPVASLPSADPVASFPSAEPDADASGDDVPWHDPNLPIAERLSLANGRGLPDRLMAAMAQLDCGQCGYECRSYSNAIANGSEKNTGLCVPGGKETRLHLKELLNGSAPALNGAHKANGSANGKHAPATPLGHDRQHPVEATFLETKNLNKTGSAKETCLVRIKLPEGVRYEVGDSLGIIPRNCPDAIARIIEQMQVDPSTPVSSDGASPRPLIEWLQELDICRPTDDLVELFAASATNPMEADTLHAWAEGGSPDGYELVDLLVHFPSARPEPAALIQSLPKLQPRLYSISSSQRAFPDEVHLTVGIVRYEHAGRQRKGVASTFLADRLEPGAALKVFVRPSHGFRLPDDGGKPIIMIGPGTGIAPFRAFLQERRAANAEGKSWLFFGDQRRDFDFLYEEEWNEYLESKTLTQVSTAFSRDSSRKVYVQDVLRQHSAEVWDWLSSGAHIYICGDAKRMAKDVHEALLDVIEREGSHSRDVARAFLKNLEKEQRYQRDVY